MMNQPPVNSPSGTPGSTAIDKANGYAIDALKQIITLASVILALTITFIKDALGDARGEAGGTFFLPLCWALLFLSIVTAGIAMVEASNTLGTIPDGRIYLFDKKSQCKAVKVCLMWARIAQVTFIVGIGALFLFALLNWSLFFRANTSKAPVPSKSQITQPSPVVYSLLPTLPQSG